MSPNPTDNPSLENSTLLPDRAEDAKGEFIVAKIRLETPLLAQYAVAHYLEQERVFDADVEG